MAVPLCVFPGRGPSCASGSEGSAVLQKPSGHCREGEAVGKSGLGLHQTPLRGGAGLGGWEGGGDEAWGEGAAMKRETQGRDRSE